MALLSEQEKQEIIRYLEADKPLPDKYRFLLFDDKRQVELVWNGKTNEVCNIVLPFQTIEHVDEPREEKKPKEPSLKCCCSTNAADNLRAGPTNSFGATIS